MEDCDHRDAYGSTIIDAMCIVCDKSFVPKILFRFSLGRFRLILSRVPW